VSKHRMTPEEHETYKRSHPYEFALDEEEGKVVREMAEFVRRRKRWERNVKDRLRHAVRGEALDDLDDMSQGDDERRANREHGNARVHKARIKDLEQYED